MRKPVIAAIFTMAAVTQLYAQQTTKGIVRDSKGNLLSSISILIKGTNIGTTTNDRGEYQIQLPQGNRATLIFSGVGYHQTEINIENKTELNVTLNSDDIGLDEIVVVGFSEVNKKHVASSVAQLDMDKIKNRPIFKMQDAFSGTMPGVTMMRGNSLPGSVPGTISIRGISTLGAADPLVIVDGMEQSIHDIDPNQVKSVTVLKDAASTAMYGSRGANGVIIIETERGQTGQFKVSTNNWFAVNKPIDLPKFVGGAEFMKLRNATLQQQGQPPVYSAEEISAFESGQKKDVNWVDEIMERTSTALNNNASVSGGGGVGTFNLMLGHIKENGLNKIEGSQKFSARFNTNINIADKFVLMADFYAHRLQVNRLLANDDGHGLYKIAWRMNPTQSIFYDIDRPEPYILHNNMNPVAAIQHGGTKNSMYDRSTINLRPKYNINKNLNIEGNVSYMINKSANKQERQTYKFFDENNAPVTIWTNNVEASQGVSESQLTARGLLNYNKDLRDSRDKVYLTLGTEVMNLTYTDYKEISKASFFGKLNYAFDNRYILELTGRSDGSSKFAPGHRWGFFPSGAVAWNAHNESFFSGLRDSKVITNLKFRGSYGLIGNENVDPYLWEESVNTWGWTMRVPNPKFSWEKQKQWNVGVDITALRDRLTVTAEVYNKNSYDLIYDQFAVPPLTGSNTLISAVNIGEVENKGWELSASWSDKKGDFSYTVGGMLFDNKNRMLKAGHNVTDSLIFKGNNNRIWYKGIPINNYYGFETNGYFQNQAEIDATQAKLPNTLPGDIRYVDRNGDGIINDQDRTYLADPLPHMNYAINITLKYKNWDFFGLGQGIGKRTGRLIGQEAYPVFVDGNSNNLGAPRVEYANDYWSAENPNSRFPRLWTGPTTNTLLSDVWLSNAAFFRVKSLQLGYTFPKIGKSFKNFRIYANAQDVFTFTKWEGLDPERIDVDSPSTNDGNGNYPRMATYSFGISTSIY
ncbi:SusC/RagA family TonB-linked outer membrane protein [Sphingobacterium psychroaquaticum]|uniref:SusC/RagA family TonB-linked outer membrane protein n=1 Tax=Sphingobacterium psychroaquaticum TaxID=561061 RepID=UPI00106C0C87|nr:SusC/RagA family TonB-linked outer membrane protein [Sphingobacterium psychroaquaticum]QBQ40962.1 SusC/RagA family TonB-linked outer membrane protein [Sphingobacterium psychroaquaticum]